MRVQPAFATPFAQRLRGIHAEEIHLWIVTFRTQLGGLEPSDGKFACTVRHVLTAEHAQPEHLPRREVGRESG